MIIDVPTYINDFANHLEGLELENKRLRTLLHSKSNLTELEEKVKYRDSEITGLKADIKQLHESIDNLRAQKQKQIATNDWQAREIGRWQKDNKHLQDLLDVQNSNRDPYVKDLELRINNQLATIQELQKDKNHYLLLVDKKNEEIETLKQVPCTKSQVVSYEEQLDVRARQAKRYQDQLNSIQNILNQRLI